MYDYVWGVVTFVLSFLFLVLYGCFSPWYKTPFGRCLMGMDLGLCIATFSTAFHAVGGSNLGSSLAYQIVVACTAWLVPVAIAWRVKLVFGEMRRRK